MGVEDNAEIFNGGGGYNGVTSEDKRSGGDFGTLLRGADKEELGFGGVERELVCGEPCLDFIKDAGEEGKGGDRVMRGEGDVKLSVVSVEMVGGVRVRYEVGEGEV